MGAIKRIQNRTASKPLRTRCKLWIYRYTHPNTSTNTNTPRLRVTDQKKKEYKYKYSGSNKVLPKIERAYFSAIFGRKIHLKTVLRPCWPLEWCRWGFITSGCLNFFFALVISNWTMISQWSNSSKITKASFFLFILKLWNPSYAILEVNTVSKQLSDGFFVQKWPRNKLLQFLAGLDCSYCRSRNTQQASLRVELDCEEGDVNDEDKVYLSSGLVTTRTDLA